MTPNEITRQLEDLGVRRGGVLVVHTSFRAVSGGDRDVVDGVDGGPAGLIAALRAALGVDGTLVMPTMTDGETRFDPTTTPTTDMGIVAETFWRLPGVVRSTHPGGSFAAVGPHAATITQPQPLSPPHGAQSPVGHAHTLGAQVLLLGVTHSENTTMHLAEDLAGVPYRIAYPTLVVNDDGDDVLVDIEETDHCCKGFDRLAAPLRARGLQREGVVGHAHAILVDAAAVVDVAVEHLRADPLFFLCAADVGCDECDAARASIVPAIGSADKDRTHP